MRNFPILAIVLAVALGCAPEQRDIPPEPADARPEVSEVAATPTISSSERFREAIEGGASCAELFDLRNQVDPSDPMVDQMNEDLRSVGCFSRSSTRQTPRGGGSDLYSLNYKTSYMVCSHDPAETLRQAGTDDPKEASAWLASTSKPGEAYEGSYNGCLDALTGKPNRFSS